MRCPTCGEDDNLVLRTRSFQNYLARENRRVRLCNACHARFETVERAADRPPAEPPPRVGRAS